MRTFGYVRQPAEGSRNSGTDLAAQEQTIRAYCAGMGWALGEVFADEAAAAGVPFFSRPGGGRLAAGLQTSDRVVIADVRWAFANLADWQGVFRSLAERGVDHHLAAQGLAVDANTRPVMETAFQLARELKRSFRSQSVREGVAAKKREGKRYSRHAGYGYRWKGGRRVVDDYESRVMRRIAEWREAGCSYYGIAAHLLRHGVPTKDGREWSPSRVRRAYLAMSAGRMEK